VVEVQHLEVVNNEQLLPGDEVTQTISVILIEDHTIVREGLKLILAQLSGVRLQGAAATGTEGVRLFESLLRQGQAPAVVISDLGLPDFSGIEVTQRIKALCPEVHVLLLSMHADPEHISGILEHGVDGYLLKQSSPAELADGIQAVARGEMVLSPSVARRLFNHMQRRIQRDETVDSLTEREREVLALLAKGYSSKEIAREFGLSIKTVGNHRTRILEKLGAANTPEAIGMAYQLGLIKESN
jgi:two-component system, NarL family, response regulator NreC